MSRRTWAALGGTAFVLIGLALFVTVVYGLVVRGGGGLLHALDRPHLGLSVLATAMVALGFEPVRVRLRGVATRLLGEGRAAPYDLLAGFHPEVVDPGDVPERMARLLAEATGARAVQVLLSVQGRAVPVATWPPGATPGATPGGERVSQPVRHAGETLGELILSLGSPLSPVEEKLLAGLADRAGLVLRAVALRAELTERLRSSTRRAQELRVSRERVVAAQDAERRRLERDIHDGAQQHLVGLAVQLRLAGTLIGRGSPRAPAAVAELRSAAEEAIHALTDLSYGIYPRRLAEGGAGPALVSALTGHGTDGVRIDLAVDTIGRLPSEVESTLYFCALEAVQNAVKHAQASAVSVEARRVGRAVEVVVADDGRGFAVGSVQAGRGLANMADRAEAVGGELEVAARPGAGTVVAIRVPLPEGG
jgi:signal transduction histidine kinase